MTARSCAGCGSALQSEPGRSEICLACAFSLALGTSERESSDEDRSRTSSTIGGYRLLERIAAEGEDELWLAEQVEMPRRPVALRLLGPGADAERTLARFEAEQQTLALLDHPCLLPVLDAGTAEGGRTFLVTGCISGATIATHCERHRLHAEERTALFLQLCEGVQHAHERGIRHLDLRASSVRVAIHGGRVTPQVSVLGVPDDSTPPCRTDVQALGALLRVLLDPPGRGPQDLSWIAASALEQGYDSPAELAADIKRHSRHEPVLAGPPGIGYRARNFVRRHRLLVAAVGLALLAVVALYGKRP